MSFAQNQILKLVYFCKSFLTFGQFETRQKQLLLVFLKLSDFSELNFLQNILEVLALLSQGPFAP